MASDEYTPETAHVREVWIWRRRIEHGLVDDSSDATSRAEFYRWLTAHDREVAAEVLRQAADEMDAEYEARTNTSGAYGQMKIRAALRTAAGLCRNRATRIEKGDDRG